MKTHCYQISRWEKKEILFLTQNFFFPQIFLQYTSRKTPSFNILQTTLRKRLQYLIAQITCLYHVQDAIIARC